MEGPLPWPAAFPVLLIRNDGAWVAPTQQRLTNMHRTVIVPMYQGLLVDSDGWALRLVGADEDRPAGFWQRWKQNQRQEIPVKLLFEGERFRLSMADVKRLLFEALARRSELAKSFMGKDRAAALERDVNSATTLGEVFRLMLEFDTIPPELR